MLRLILNEEEYFNIEAPNIGSKTGVVIKAFHYECLFQGKLAPSRHLKTFFFLSDERF